MRLLTWNVNHRTHEKAIKPEAVAALAALAPDVVVLTEYVHGPTRDTFVRSIADLGLPHHLVSTKRGKHNQVLIASCHPLEPGHLLAPDLAEAVPSNFLHASLPALGIQVLGFRMPDFKSDAHTRRACWDWVLEVAGVSAGSPTILLGDFNTDAKYTRARCGDRLGRLVEDGWQHASPVDGFSFWTLNGQGVRIDHAFVTPHFQVKSAAYVVDAGGHSLAGKKTSLSDHAALVIEIDREEEGAA